MGGTAYRVPHHQRRDFITSICQQLDICMTSKRQITILFFISFLILGLALPLIGVTLGDLTARFGMPLENGGLFNVVASLGMVIATGVAGRLYDRLNARVILPVGVAIVAAAMISLFLAPTRLIGFTVTFFVGLGFGIYMIGPNILVARLNPGKATGPLNAINLAFGIGAIISPQIVTLGALLGEVRLAYLFTGIPIALLIIPSGLVNLAPPPISEDSTHRGNLNLAALLPFAVLFFCAMSVEVGFNSWIVTQLEKAANAPRTTANFGASMFWIGYTASRTGSTWLGHKIKPERLLVGAISMVGIGLTLMLSVPASQQIGIISAFIVGIGIGPIFPTDMSLTSQAFPQSLGQVTGILSAISSIGPMTMTWLQGQVGAGQDGGMEVVLVLAVILMGAVLYIMWRKPGALSQTSTAGVEAASSTLT